MIEKHGKVILTVFIISIFILGPILAILPIDPGSAATARADPLPIKPPVWADGGPLNLYNSVGFSQNGKICAASTDNDLMIFDLKLGKVLQQIPSNRFKGADSRVLDIDNGGRFILAVDTSNHVYIITVSNGSIAYQNAMDRTVSTGAISGNGEYFALGSGEPYNQNFLTVFRNPAWSVPDSPDGRSSPVDITDSSSRASRTNHTGPLHSIEYNNLITSIDFSFNGTTFVAGSWDKTVRLFSIADPTPVWIFNADNVTTTFVSINKVNSVDITPDGKSIAAGVESGIVIFNSSSSDPSNFWSTRDNGTATVGISDDGKIITSGGNNLVIFNVDTAAPVWQYHLENGTISLVKQSRDGNKIAVVGKTVDFDSIIMMFDYSGSMPDWYHKYSSLIEGLEITGDGTHLGILSQGIPVIAVFETSAPGSGTTLDGDGDQIADTWELANGLNITIDDAYIDSDGDLFTNLQEFEGGTDPWLDTDFPGAAEDSYKHLTPKACKRDYRDPFGDVRFVTYSSDIQDFEDRGTDISLYREVDILNLTSFRLNDTLKVKLELARKPELKRLETDILTESMNKQQSGNSDNNSLNQNATRGPGSRSKAGSSFSDLSGSKVFYAVYFVTSNFTEKLDITSGYGSFEPDEKLSDSSFSYTDSNQSGLSSMGTATTIVKLDRTVITWTIPLKEISYLPANFEIFAAAWFATGDPAEIILSPEDVAIIYDSAGFGSAVLDKTKFPLRTIKEILDGREVNIDFQGTGYLNLQALTNLELPEPAKLRQSIGVFIDLVLENGSLADAEIRIGYDDSELGNTDEKELKLFYWNNATGEWVIIQNSGVYTNNNTVWGKVDHFTIFAPMAETTDNQGTGDEGDESDGGFRMPSIFGLSIVIWIAIGIALTLVFGFTGMVYRRRGGEAIRKPDYTEDDTDFTALYDDEDGSPGQPPDKPMPPKPGTPKPPIRKGKPESGKRTPPPPPPPAATTEDGGGIDWDDDEDDEDDELDTMPCPKCGSTITILSTKRPLSIECQDCGAKGKLK